MNFRDITVESVSRTVSTYTMPNEYPRLSGTWILAVGGPRTGKTHWTTKLACKASIRWGLPLVAQDVTGNVRSRIDGFIAQAKADIARGVNVNYNRHVVAQLSDATLYTGEDTADMLDTIQGMVNASRAKSWKPRWQAIVLLDEGAIIRQYNERFMDATAPLFGNAGILGYLTAQRDVGASPALRACERAVLPFPGAELYTNHLGFEIPAGSELSRKGRLFYKYGNDYKVWDGNNPYPEELITPAALSETILERI